MPQNGKPCSEDDALTIALYEHVLVMSLGERASVLSAIRQRPSARRQDDNTKPGDPLQPISPTQAQLTLILE